MNEKEWNALPVATQATIVWPELEPKEGQRRIRLDACGTECETDAESIVALHRYGEYVRITADMIEKDEGSGRTEDGGMRPFGIR